MENTDKKVLNKSIMILLIIVAVFVIVLLVVGRKGTKIDNLASTITKQAIVNINGNNLVASVADTPLEREKGLSGQHIIDDKSGMYFVFEESDTHTFWMKDMKFRIDILWINELNEIVHIEENVGPDSYPAVFTPPVPAKYVLEVNAGWVKRNGVSEGDTIMVTSVEQETKN